MKMDIEGPEFASMELMMSKKRHYHIRQLALEVHIFMWEFNKAKFIYAITVLEKLKEEGFELYLSHENPMGIYQNNILNKKITCCHEVYYVNTKYRIGNDD